MKLKFLIALAITLACYSCREADLNLQEPRTDIVTENGYGCTSYSELEFLEGNESINHLLVQSDLIYYSNFDDEIKVYNTNSDELITLETDLSTFEIIAKDRDVLFCTDQGVYQVIGNDLASFELINAVGCRNIEIGPSAEVYFSSWNPVPPEVSGRSIYEITTNGTLSVATAEADEQLSHFKVSGKGEFFCFNGSNTDKLYRFDKEGALLDVFEEANAPLGKDHFESEIWSVQSGGRLLFVLKNGFGYPNILEWNEETGGLHNYINEAELEQSRSGGADKVSDLVAPSYVDIELEGSDLFIVTTLASCRGVLKLNLPSSPTSTLRLDDMEVIRDEGFSIGHCLQGMQLLDDKKYFYSQKGVMLLEFCE